MHFSAAEIAFCLVQEDYEGFMWLRKTKPSLRLKNHEGPASFWLLQAPQVLKLVCKRVGSKPSAAGTVSGSRGKDRAASSA